MPLLPVRPSTSWWAPVVGVLLTVLWVSWRDLTRGNIPDKPVIVFAVVAIMCAARSWLIGPGALSLRFLGCSVVAQVVLHPAGKLMPRGTLEHACGFLGGPSSAVTIAGQVAIATAIVALLSMSDLVLRLPRSMVRICARLLATAPTVPDGVPRTAPRTKIVYRLPEWSLRAVDELRGPPRTAVAV